MFLRENYFRELVVCVALLSFISNIVKNAYIL